MPAKKQASAAVLARGRAPTSGRPVPATGRGEDHDLPVGDFARWAMDQATLIRAGDFGAVDRDRVAEEIEDLGRSEYNALQSDLTVVLHHMLKWEIQPHRRSRVRELSIREHRRRVTRRLAASPSLAARLPSATAEAFEDARDRAMAETGAREAQLPETCPYSWADITERPFIHDA